MSTAGTRTADPGRRREHRAWYAYDAGASAFNTSVITVFAGPYITGMAEVAADGADTVSLLGLQVATGSVFLYGVSVSVMCQVLVLPLVGAVADRSPNKPRLLGLFSAIGVAATIALALTSGGAWLAAGLALLVGNVAFGAAAVVYDSFLPEIALPDERDAVSSRGWALGYLGGGTLLALHLVLFLLEVFPDARAAQVAIATSGLWWLTFASITVRGVRSRPPLRDRVPGEGVAASFRELAATFRQLRRAPLTLRFLVGYLLYNDGVQTVIAAAAVFGSDELGLEEAVLIQAILIVQVVAFVSALALAKVAARIGAKATVLGTLVVWTAVIGLGRNIPAGDPVIFTVLAACIGLVLGPTQALSRSMFSQLVPDGREAEYFGLYQISERGTSWIGTLALGLAVQLTGSYRSGIVVLIAFFVLGGVVLAATDLRRAIAEAGNPVPERV